MNPCNGEILEGGRITKMVPFIIIIPYEKRKMGTGPVWRQKCPWDGESQTSWSFIKTRSCGVLIIDSEISFPDNGSLLVENHFCRFGTL